jgi:predicted aminopeptidase
MRFLYGVIYCVALMYTSSCTVSRFLTQAAAGQWHLNRRSQPIDELLAQPTTSAEIRARLGQLEFVKAYGSRHGLLMHKNYRDYIQLDQPYVVWFVNGSHPLAFLPLTFSFPIVGSFPGLSWFDEQRAIEFKERLETRGWDVNLRGVTAFSTGGWFRDPVLSSMYFDHPAQIGYFANTILHESVHATVLVPDQQYFNESLASFVADTMTPPFLAEAYKNSPETRAAYEETRKTGEYIIERLLTTFKELDTVYQSERSDEAKLAAKTKIIDDLMTEIPFPVRPNNATLIGFQLYQEGTKEFTPGPLQRAANDGHRSNRSTAICAEVSTLPQACLPPYANQATAPARRSPSARARATHTHTQREVAVSPIGVDGIANIG